jgi:hypothetical protein
MVRKPQAVAALAADFKVKLLPCDCKVKLFHVIAN